MQTSQAQTPQMQTPTAIHLPDTSVPMDINQSQPRPEMHTCYNCSKPGHLSCACTKPLKQRIQSTTSAEMEAVAAAMDVREVAKKAEQAKESEKLEDNFQAGQW